MPATQVEVPALGESITQAILVKWHKADGESVRADEPICELETDKANVDVPAPVAGVVRHVKEEGQTVRVGEPIARIDPAGATVATASVQPAIPGSKADPLKSPGIPSPSASSSADSAPARTADDLSPAVRTLVMEKNVDVRGLKGSGPGGRITREDVLGYSEKRGGNGSKTESPAPESTPPAPTKPTTTANFDASGIRRVAMSKIRKRIADTLVRAQQTAAILTTFNEIDMSAVLDLRSKYKERFQEVHGVGLGFMSFFARAASMALKELPHVNAEIDGNDIVYHNYVHLGLAVSTDRGLAVPVMRNIDQMSFARIETEIKRLAVATRDGKLGLEELSGGTFTITNGGVFGSLLSTPIINPPQSAILGMHAIQKRPVAIGDKIEIRPMMYVALSYDHRIIDGKEAITFLVRLKQLVEDPTRLMLEI